MLLLALLLAVACEAHNGSSKLPQDQELRFQRMVEWTKSQYRHHGVQDRPLHFNVAAGINSKGIRGIFAIEDIPKGGIIFTVPAASVLPVGGRSQDDVESTMRLLKELVDPNSRYRPYLDMLPGPGEVFNFCNFPQEYDNMLQSPFWAFYIQSFRYRLWDAHSGSYGPTASLLSMEEAAGPAAWNVTLEQLAHVCALASSRTVDMLPRPTTAMLPIFDLSNHNKRCTAQLAEASHLGPWDHDFHMITTQGLQAGDEICYQYSDNRDDNLLVEYGFMPGLPEGQDSDGLFMVDHRNFTFDAEHAAANGLDTWPEAKGPDASDLPELTPEAAREEQQRLRSILAGLDEWEQTHPNPPATPGTEPLYDQILEFQRRRRAALRAEIAKLEARVACSSGGGGGDGSCSGSGRDSGNSSSGSGGGAPTSTTNSASGSAAQTPSPDASAEALPLLGEARRCEGPQ